MQLLKSTTPVSCAGFHFHRKTYINSLLQSISPSLKTVLRKIQDTKPPSPQVYSQANTHGEVAKIQPPLPI